MRKRATSIVERVDRTSQQWLQLATVYTLERSVLSAIFMLLFHVLACKYTVYNEERPNVSSQKRNNIRKWVWYNTLVLLVYFNRSSTHQSE